MGDQSVLISGAALIVSVIVLITGYLRQPTFIPAAQAVGLRERIALLEAEVETLRRNLEFQDGRVKVLMAEREFWQTEFRELREKIDNAHE